MSELIDDRVRASIRASLSPYAEQIQVLLRRLFEPDGLSPDSVAAAREECRALAMALEDDCARLSGLEPQNEADRAEVTFLLKALRAALAQLQPATVGYARLGWYVAAHLAKAEIDRCLEQLAA
jgi:hypothetical protein